MIFALCRSAGVPIWHVDQLKTPQGTVDVGLIRDEANELALRRGPRPELPPLADDLADTVAQARIATQASTDTTPVESIPGSSIAPSSSHSPSTDTGPACKGPKTRGTNGHSSASYPAVDAEVDY